MYLIKILCSCTFGILNYTLSLVYWNTLVIRKQCWGPTKDILKFIWLR